MLMAPRSCDPETPFLCATATGSGNTFAPACTFQEQEAYRVGEARIHFDKRATGSATNTSGLQGEKFHIAIVNVDFARWLLQKNKSLLVDQAVGSFFTSGGPCPWGGFPLSFAAATNQPEMIDLLLENGADLFAEDADGMTALNIAVRSDMPDMYNKLADLADSTYTKCGIEEDQMKTLRRSCLQTSVLSNKPGMFELLLDRSKITMWTYGPVASCLYPLSHLDCSMGSGDDDDGGEEEETSSILNMVIQNERFDILRSSVVSKLVDLKWEKFGRAAFSPGSSCTLVSLPSSPPELLSLRCLFRSTTTAILEASSWHSSSKVAVVDPSSV